MKRSSGRRTPGPRTMAAAGDAGPGSDDGLGVPTDTLASTAKSKSLQGRNRELRFICEREKRIIDWEWHSVKVQFEKEKMLFKKRALRMLEAPRRRFRRPPGEEEVNEEEEPPEEAVKVYTGRRRFTVANAGNVRRQLEERRPLSRPGSGTSSSRTVSSISSTTDENVMLEELQELNARLNQEKKACRSAPLTRNSVLTDPLYQLSSRLPKLETEFSEMIKEHNGLRRRKVEFKIKDFLVRIEAFKKEQKRGQELNLLQKDGVVPMVTFMEVNNKDSNKQDTDGEVFEESVPVEEGKKPVPGNHRKHRITPHSAIATVANNNRSAGTGSKSERRSASRVSYQDKMDDVTDPDDVRKARLDVTLGGVVPKRTPPKVDIEHTIMLKMWEDFTKDMSVDALKRLMSFAAKNKFNATNNSRSRSNFDPTNPSFISNFKSASVFRKFLESLSSTDGD